MTIRSSTVVRLAGFAAVSLSALALSGCEAPRAPGYTRSAGSLALSRDDAFLYAVDADNDLLVVVDTKTEEKVASIQVGRSPEHVTVGPDERIYVSNRLGRSVSIVERGQWTESAQVQVGVEPAALSASADGRTLYVVSSAALDTTETGTLTAVDVANRTARWTLPVGPDPRGLALISGGRALVSLSKQGDVAMVDLDKPALLSAGTSLYQKVNASQGQGFRGDFGPLSLSTFHPRGMVDLSVAPEGNRIYAPTVWAREDVVSFSPSAEASGGDYGSGGPCNVGSVATSGVVTVDGDGQPMADDLTQCSASGSDGKDYPPTVTFSPQKGVAALQGPVASVVDPTGSWLFVVERETNNVAVMPTHRRTGSDLPLSQGGTTVRDLIPVGAGPTGIALTRDGMRAYVFNAFDHTISTLSPSGTGDTAWISEDPAQRIRVAEDVLPPDVVAGRKLFFDARDSRMSNPDTGTSCATCHLDGREDGHVWQFDDGPRQTPSLAGRKLAETAPYHWRGEFPSMPAFLDTTVRSRMGGEGLNVAEAQSISTFIEAQPVADNPNAGASLTEAQARGKALFAQANCGSCHSGEALTNNGFSDVGTDLEQKTFNVPSLLGLARTAPYLHDGSAATLDEALRLSRQSGRHGQLAGVTDAQLADLRSYLESL